MLGYNVSKKLAEQAAWRFLSENSPSFDLTILNPDIVMGPMLQPLSSSKSVNETNAFTTLNFLNGTYKDIDSVRFPFNHFVGRQNFSCPPHALRRLVLQLSFVASLCSQSIPTSG